MNTSEKSNNYVDLSNIPNKKKNHKNYYSWSKSIGCNIPFKYFDVVGVLTVYKHIPEKQAVQVSYKNQLHIIQTQSLVKCNLAKIVIDTNELPVIYKKNENKWIDLSNVPRICRNNKICFDWTNSIGSNITFNYNGIKGSFEIKSYNSKTQKVEILYNGKTYFVQTVLLLNCNIGLSLQLRKSVLETHPELAQYITNKSDANKYTYGSTVKMSFTCPQCKQSKLDYLSNISTFGY